jgi:hypothetical protein
MNEITIRAEMTLREYDACQDALRYGRGVPIVIWAVLTTGAASLASSAALTWGTPASILAALALAAFIFSIIFSSLITAARRQQAYRSYRESESNTTYIFTNERILATSPYAQSSLAWAGVDRVMEIKTVYLLVVGNSHIYVPKRDIPPDNFGNFVQLLKTHRLLRQA